MIEIRLNRLEVQQRIREIVKALGASALHYTQLDRIIAEKRGFRQDPLVLGYHRVVRDYESAASRSIAPNLISVETLERQIDFLSEQFEFITLDRLVSVIEGREVANRPIAAITFDDGYRDVYLNAYPMLRRKGIPFAVFVVSDLVGTQNLLPHDEIYLLTSEVISRGIAEQAYQPNVFNYENILSTESSESLCNRLISARNAFTATRTILESIKLKGIKSLIAHLNRLVKIDNITKDEFKLVDWDMLSEMAANGVTIGSHTKSHTILAHEGLELVKDEIANSRKDLERNLRLPIKHFAYPDGSFDRAAIREIRRAGYISAHTTCSHRDSNNPLMTISRRLLWEKSSMNGFNRFSPSVLACQANGFFDPAAKCHRDHWG